MPVIRTASPVILPAAPQPHPAMSTGSVLSITVVSMFSSSSDSAISSTAVSTLYNPVASSPVMAANPEYLPKMSACPVIILAHISSPAV